MKIGGDMMIKIFDKVGKRVFDAERANGDDIKIILKDNKKVMREIYVSEIKEQLKKSELTTEL
jgi:hypothetical protein